MSSAGYGLISYYSSSACTGNPSSAYIFTFGICNYGPPEGTSFSGFSSAKLFYGGAFDGTMTLLVDAYEGSSCAGSVPAYTYTEEYNATACTLASAGNVWYQYSYSSTPPIFSQEGAVAAFYGTSGCSSTPYYHEYVAMSTSCDDDVYGVSSLTSCSGNSVTVKSFSNAVCSGNPQFSLVTSYSCGNFANYSTTTSCVSANNPLSEMFQAPNTVMTHISEHRNGVETSTRFRSATINTGMSNILSPKVDGSRMVSFDETTGQGKIFKKSQALKPQSRSQQTIPLISLNKKVESRLLKNVTQIVNVLSTSTSTSAIPSSLSIPLSTTAAATPTGFIYETVAPGPCGALAAPPNSIVAVPIGTCYQYFSQNSAVLKYWGTYQSGQVIELNITTYIYSGLGCVGKPIHVFSTPRQQCSTSSNAYDDDYNGVNTIESVTYSYSTSLKFPSGGEYSSVCNDGTCSTPMEYAWAPYSCISSEGSSYKSAPAASGVTASAYTQPNCVGPAYLTAQLTVNAQCILESVNSSYSTSVYSSTSSGTSPDTLSIGATVGIAAAAVVVTGAAAAGVAVYVFKIPLGFATKSALTTSIING